MLSSTYYIEEILKHSAILVEFMMLVELKYGIHLDLLSSAVSVIHVDVVLATPVEFRSVCLAKQN